MTLRRTSWFAGAFWLALGTARAQTASPRVVTFREALELAQTHPNVRTARARVETAAAGVDVAGAARNPQVTLGLQAGVTAIDQPIVPESDIRIQATGALAQATVNAQWMLYDFGHVSSMVKSARAGEATAAADASTARLNAVLDAAVRYLTVSEDEESLVAFKAALDTRLELQRVTHELVAQGLRPPIDEGRVQVEVDVAQFDLMVAGYRLQQDTVELASALGLDPTSELRVEPVGDALVSADDDPKRAAAAAEAARPELQALRAQLAQSRADVESARTARLPTLAALAQGQAGRTEVLSGIGVSGRNESGQVGLSLSIPVLDPVRSAQRTVAEKSSIVAAERLRAARLSIRNDAVRAALAVRGSRALLAQAERVRSGASANAATARERYARGMTPVIDELIEAQARERSATSDVIRARLVLQVACARLLSSIGAATLVAGRGAETR